MECSAPPPLTDDQISTALDRVAEPEVLAHLARCSGCARRLAEAQQMEQELKSRLYRWDCPPPQQLADYYARRLGREQVAALEAHLAGCASCSAEMEDLRQFMAAEPPLTAPPPAPLRPSHPARGALFARPQTQRPAVALRGAGSGPLMAEAEGTTIFIDAQPAGGQIAIHGQLVDPDQDRWAGALVEIRQAGQLIATAEVDDLGSFAAAGLSAGVAELRVTPLAGRMVVLGEVDLGPGDSG